MNDLIEAGRRVAARLFPAENTIDDAIIANASLQIALVTARRETQQPAGVIQLAIQDAVESAAALSEARRKMVGVHARIVKMRTEMGVPGYGFGCEAPCLQSDQPAEQAEATKLKAV